MWAKEEIARQFSCAAPGYEQHALLQKKMADRIFEKVQNLSPKRIIDLGCGTGYLARRLAKRFSEAEVLGIDLASGMIEVAKKEKLENLEFMVKDAEDLSFLEKPYDLAVSNASLQWMNLKLLFSSLKKILREGGSFCFSTFGPQTLQELRELGFRINKFFSAEEISALLQHLGFFSLGHFMIEKEIITQDFKNVKEVILHLKDIGANITEKSEPKILGRSMLKNPISVSFELIFIDGKIYETPEG